MCVYLWYGAASADQMPDKEYDATLREARKYFMDKQFDHAREQYYALIAAEPERPEAYMEIGNMYYERQEYAKAFHWYKKGSKCAPHFYDFYMGMGNVYREQKEYKKAMRMYTKALTYDPTNNRARNRIASVYDLQGNNEEAESWYSETIRRSPDDWDTYMKWGDFYRQNQSYDKALEILQTGIERCPEESDRMKAIMARVYKDMGNFEKAEELLLGIASHRSNFKDNYWGCPFQALGELYAHMTISDQKKKVLENYKRSADMQPYKAHAQYEAAYYFYEYGDYGHAAEYITKALLLPLERDEYERYSLLKGYIYIAQREYENARALLQGLLSEESFHFDDILVAIGHIDLAEKNNEGASQKFKQKLERNSEDEMANLGMGWLYSNIKEHAKALTHYEAILQKNPHHIWALLGKGNSLIGLERLEEAQKLYHEVLVRDPQNEYAYAELGGIAYDRGAIDQAESYYNKALAFNADGFTCPYEGLGLVYFKQGKLHDAASSFQKAITINPNIEYKKYNGLARIYIKEKKYKEAEQLLLKSIENYPYDSEAKEMLELVRMQSLQSAT